MSASRPYFIGVAGGSASGKTTVCRQLERILGASAITIISIDSFYADLTPNQLDNIADVNFDVSDALTYAPIVPDAFDHESLLECLVRITQIPEYSFVSSSRVGSITVLPSSVIVVEGILTLYWSEIRDLLDLSIFVDAPSDVRLCRRVLRDQASRGRSIESILAQYESHVKPSFDDFISPTKQFADIVIPWDRENSVAVQLIAEHISARSHNAFTAVESNQSKYLHFKDSSDSIRYLMDIQGSRWH